MGFSTSLFDGMSSYFITASYTIFCVKFFHCHHLQLAWAVQEKYFSVILIYLLTTCTADTSQVLLMTNTVSYHESQLCMSSERTWGPVRSLAARRTEFGPGTCSLLSTPHSASSAPLALHGLHKNNQDKASPPYVLPRRFWSFCINGHRHKYRRTPKIAEPWNSALLGWEAWLTPRYTSLPHLLPYRAWVFCIKGCSHTEPQNGEHCGP